MRPKKRYQSTAFRMIETPFMVFRLYQTERGRKIATAKFAANGWHTPLYWNSGKLYGLVMKKPTQGSEHLEAFSYGIRQLKKGVN